MTQSNQTIQYDCQELHDYYRISKPVHPGHKAHHGRWRALPHVEGEAQRGARDDEVVVDGEDGVRGEPPDGPEPVVEAVGLVDLEPHGAAPGAVDEDAPAQGLRRRPRLAPHDVDGLDARAGGVVRDGPPQKRVAAPRVDHHREAAAGSSVGGREWQAWGAAGEWSAVGNGRLPRRGAGAGGGGDGALAVQRERDRERGGRGGDGEEAEGEACRCRGESAGGGSVAGRLRVATAAPRAEAEAEAEAVPPVRRRLKLEQQLGHPGHGLTHLAHSN